MARILGVKEVVIPPASGAASLNEDLVTLLGENVRKSADVLGDLHSFVAANQLGAERLLAVMADYGMHDLRALAAVIQKSSEETMREAIRALPDGVYGSEIFNNPLGTRLRYPVEVTVRGDTVAVDFAGAPPQQPVGGLNCTYTYTAAHATYALKCILSPQTRSNAGCYRPFTVTAPAGSILNCDKPAAVNLRTRTGWYIAPNIFRALVAAAPDQVQAATGLPHAVNIYGCGWARVFRSFLHGRRPGRLGARRRQVGPALPNLRRQHVDRAPRDQGTRAGAGKDAGHRQWRRGPTARRPRHAHQRAKAPR